MWPKTQQLIHNSSTMLEAWLQARLAVDGQAHQLPKLDWLIIQAEGSHAGGCRWRPRARQARLSSPTCMRASPWCWYLSRNFVTVTQQRCPVNRFPSIHQSPRKSPGSREPRPPGAQASPAQRGVILGDGRVGNGVACGVQSSVHGHPNPAPKQLATVWILNGQKKKPPTPAKKVAGATPGTLCGSSRPWLPRCLLSPPLPLADEWSWRRC